MERALPSLRALEHTGPRAPFVRRRRPAPRERARARSAPPLSGRRLAVRACLDGLAFFSKISNNAGSHDHDRETCRTDHLGRLGREPEDGGQRPGPRTAAVLQLASSELSLDLAEEASCRTAAVRGPGRWPPHGCRSTTRFFGIVPGPCCRRPARTRGCPTTRWETLKSAT